MLNYTAPHRVADLTLVFAIDENGVMGRDGTMAWRSPQDFKWFKSLTTGGSTIMGRKTWEDIPEAFRPLPGRDNYVVSSDPSYVAPGAITATSLQDAISKAQNKNRLGRIFVIGGKGLLEEAAKIATNAYVSHIGVKTPVDELTLMGPDLPMHEVVSTLRIFKGSEKHPSVKVENIVFFDLD